MTDDSSPIHRRQLIQTLRDEVALVVGAEAAADDLLGDRRRERGRLLVDLAEGLVARLLDVAGGALARLLGILLRAGADLVCQPLCIRVRLGDDLAAAGL